MEKEREIEKGGKKRWREKLRERERERARERKGLFPRSHPGMSQTYMNNTCIH